MDPYETEELARLMLRFSSMGDDGSVRQLAPLRTRGRLARWTDRGKRTPELPQRIKRWSRCIGGESVADYFSAVLQHVYNGAPRPVAPWLGTRFQRNRRGGTHNE